MLTQRARARAEIGDVAPARQDAAAALRALVGDPDDVTASAIGAAAAELLFQTAPWGQESLDQLITAIDTALSWWRTQTVSTALRAAADRTFRQWGDDRATTRIDFEDTVNDRLFAAVVSADLTGEQGTWRTTGSLLARNTLMVQHAGGDTSHQAGALDELRRSGDEKSLALAARRLWAIGPLGPLAEAARRIQPGSWTHTTARANLALWQHAGDVLDEATASDAARYCLDVVTDSSAFVSRTTPSFLVVPYTLDALAGLLGAADDAVHRDLARYIAGLPPVTDQLEARGWARVAGALRPTVIAAAEDRAAWRQIAVSQPHPGLAAAILGLLTDHDEAARELLCTRIAGGDNHALAALGPDHVDELDAQVAEQLMAQDAELLAATIAQLQQGVHPIRTRDPAERLAVLGAHFADVAPWDALLRYLGHARLPSERKRIACLALAQHGDRFPVPVRSALPKLIPQLKVTVPALNVLGDPFGGAGMILAAGVGALDDQTLTDGLPRLLAGSPPERRDAAALIARLDRPELIAALVGLLGDHIRRFAPKPAARSRYAWQARTPVTTRWPSLACNKRSPTRECRCPSRSPTAFPLSERQATKPANSSRRCSTTAPRLSVALPPVRSPAEAWFAGPNDHVAKVRPPHRSRPVIAVRNESFPMVYQPRSGWVSGSVSAPAPGRSAP
jgi:hypothetical protein